MHTTENSMCGTTINNISEAPLAVDDDSLDDISRRLRREALEALQEEPELSTLLHRTVLAPGVRTFEDAVAMTTCFRLLLHPCKPSSQSSMPASLEPMFCPDSLRNIIRQALYNKDALEYGHTMAEAVRLDALAVCERDPACDTILEVVLFMKGFAALVCHRAARQVWERTLARKSKRRSMTALFLQSQASAVFGLDIHPAATMGAGIFLDHGTGIVVGETAMVGDGCTILHGVTLGGTGKDSGDRHPKVGAHVLIGANASILGNVRIGNAAKIGAGSVVLRPIPDGATAVGAPAKIIGRALESDPASTVDENLNKVALLHKSSSAGTFATDLSSTVASSSVGGNSSIADETGADDNSSLGTDAPLNANCCPFREFRRLGKAAPPGSVTMDTLEYLLAPYDTTDYEIGSILFDLDERSVGYIKWPAFEDGIPDALKRHTQLTEEQIQSVLESFTTSRPVVGQQPPPNHHRHHRPKTTQIMSTITA